MEDHYDHEFDRLFARDLKAAGQNAAPDPEEWSALSSRLDGRRRGRWPLLLPWFLLAALAVSNGWMLLQWRNLHREVADVQPSPATTTPSATRLPEHRTTIVYDTVYRTVVITRQVVEERLSSDEKKQSDRKSLSNNGTLSHQAEKNITSAKQTGAEEKTITNKSEKQSAKLVNSIESQGINTQKEVGHPANHLIPAISYASPDSLTQSTADTLQKQPAIAAESPDSLTQKPSAELRFDSLVSNAPIIKRHRTPLRWRIEAGIGVAGPLTDIDLEVANPLSLSLHAEVLLGRHWAVVPGVTYAGHSYKMHRRFDPRLLLNAPVLPGPEYGFRYIEGDMAHLMTSLAVRYRFRPEQKWSWYVDAGYAARFTVSSTAEYEFDRHSTGESYHYEIRPTVPNRVQMGLTQAGVEYSVNPRWTLFVEASGLFDFGPGQRTFPTGIGQLGVKWGRK